MSPVLSTPSILRQLYKLLFKLHSAPVLGCEKYNRDWAAALKVRVPSLQFLGTHTVPNKTVLAGAHRGALRAQSSCTGNNLRWPQHNSFNAFPLGFTCGCGWKVTILNLASLSGLDFLSGTISCLEALHSPYIIVIHLHDSQAPLSAVHRRAEDEVDGLPLIKTTVFPCGFCFSSSSSLRPADQDIAVILFN